MRSRLILQWTPDMDLGAARLLTEAVAGWIPGARVVHALASWGEIRLPGDLAGTRSEELLAMALARLDGVAWSLQD